LATGSLFGNLFGGGGKGTLCIDIGSNSVKFVKMEGGRVTDYGFKEIGEAFDVPSILRELIKDYKPGEVFSFVSGPSVSLRQAPFPKMNRRELKDAILLRLVKFSPFMGSAELTMADCAAVVHLPLVSQATKVIYGEDMLAGLNARDYLKMLFERPSVVKVNADRKVNAELRAKR